MVQRPMLRLSLGLGAALVLGKAVLLDPPTGLVWLRDLVAVTWEDAAFAAVLGILGSAALAASRGRPGAARAVERGLLATGTLCVAYVVL